MNAPAKKQRARRIAADEAHAWARNLRLRNPYAKLLLCMLTQYVNGEGSCFVGIPTLAEDCEFAQETVRRRLAWLESIGAIARFPQWIDEAGKRNTEGRGRRTTDDIRLLLTAEQEDIEARAGGAETADDTDETAAADPVSQTGSQEARDLAGTLVGLQQPPTCGEGLDSLEPEPEDSPQAPLGGPSDSAVEGWEEFKTVWESDGDPIVKVTLAKTIFAALTPDERPHVTRAARGLIAKRSRDKRPGTKPSAQSFLREREAWPAFEKLAQDAEQIAAQRVVPVNSREGRAWLAILRMIGSVGFPPHKVVDGGRGFLAPVELTPQALALGDAVNEHGGPEGKWIKVAAGNNEFGAWRRLVGELINRDFNPIYGVPAPFPPRADGSWPEFQLKQSA